MSEQVSENVKEAQIVRMLERERESVLECGGEEVLMLLQQIVSSQARDIS